MTLFFFGFLSGAYALLALFSGMTGLWLMATMSAAMALSNTLYFINVIKGVVRQ